MSTRYLALLRGINVGGKNKLPMKDLVELFVEAGCRDVRTYIQSGNVLFTVDSHAVAPLPKRVSARIAERFGYRVPVVVRTAAQLGEVVRGNPFIEQGVAEDALHVLFLADHRGERDRFAARIAAMQDEYPTRSGLLQRLRKAGLIQDRR